jgi:hypothetical protein
MVTLPMTIHVRGSLTLKQGSGNKESRKDVDDGYFRHKPAYTGYMRRNKQCETVDRDL